MCWFIWQTDIQTRREKDRQMHKQTYTHTLTLTHTHYSNIYKRLTIWMTHISVFIFFRQAEHTVVMVTVEHGSWGGHQRQQQHLWSAGHQPPPAQQLSRQMTIQLTRPSKEQMMNKSVKPFNWRFSWEEPNPSWPRHTKNISRSGKRK